MKLSDYVLKFLEDKKIETMFFVPGGGCMHLADSLAQSKKINAVNLLHEQSVAIAAESYAFTSGHMGAALVTTGPGGTNAVTGVLSAYLDSIPCIFISGQVKTSDLKTHFGVRSHGSQEADIVGIVKDITKYAVMVTDKSSIRYHLEKAWYEANSGRKGPVWVDIPLDIQGSNIEPDHLINFTEPTETKANLQEEAKNILSYIRKSKRPIIIAGNGIRGAEEQFYNLIERLNIPVIPTWKAVDLLANNHPLFAGKCGTLGERAANFAMQTSDLIISLGSKLDFSITGFDRSRWAVKAKKIVVEIDETEIYKLQTKIGMPIVADVKLVIEAMLDQIENNKEFNLDCDFSKWINKIHEWKSKYPISKPANALGIMNASEISTYDLIEEISKQAEENTVIVPSSAGTVAEICYQALRIKKGQKVRSNHGLGSMGYELPAAIGAYYATGNPVITVTGDGGMQLNIQELAIIAGRNLPIKIFVVNNQGYSSIRNMQRNHFEGRYIGSNVETGLLLPDMETLAKAYGIQSNTVEKPESLERAVEEVLSSQGAFLCDVHIDPFCIVSPRSTSKVLPDGSIVSTPLEDLFPFLQEDELKRELEVENL
ncbi:thiamine pyrophosphate-binding protein [Aminipila sp.]|uniref:thiamine pyrophosphate-binding protein n=1 Tax=Aminipila sp. TaxID=2060095 RepID=UPI00289F305E|nr:thiamine pyrophosphate-binding protein [Aminipila sp.]